MKNKRLPILAALFLFSILILNIFLISIKADSPPVPDLGLGNINPETGLPVELEKIQTIGGKFTNEEDRTQYLKQEWGKILANNKFFGPIIAAYEKISPYTDPVFKYTLGITPSLSWLFILTLTLWIAFVVYTLRILDLVSIFSKWVQYLMSFGFVIIISITGITKKLAEYIISAISLFTTWWMQLIGIGIIIIALVLASVFSKNIKEIGESMKEKKEKDEEEINRKKLKANVQVAETFTKGITGK